MGNLARLLWESVIKAGLEEFWKWFGGKLWPWVVGLAVSAALRLVAWLLGLDQSWVRASLIAGCLFLAIILLHMGVVFVQRRRIARLPLDSRYPGPPDQAHAATTSSELPASSGAPPAPPALDLNLKREEIDNFLNGLPPKQRPEAAKHYIGVTVEWEGKLTGTMTLLDSSRVGLLLDCGDSLFTDTLAVVPAAPGLGLLQEGATVKVTGVIWDPQSLSGVTLDPARVVSIERS